MKIWQQSIRLMILVSLLMGSAGIVHGAQKSSAKTTPRRVATNLTPQMLISQLYREHHKDSQRLFDTKNRTYLEKYFDKNLVDLIWRELHSSSEEVGNLDFDPLYNAQDYQITELKVSEPEYQDNSAKLIVTFKNFGKKVALTFQMTKVAESWKISNIIYDRDSNLIQILNLPK